MILVFWVIFGLMIMGVATTALVMIQSGHKMLGHAMMAGMVTMAVIGLFLE